VHGLTANASKMAGAKKWIEDDYPGIYVHNVEIGDGAITSLFKFLPEQVRMRIRMRMRWSLLIFTSTSPT
jgi:predicted nicotinamide N-methyase